MMNRWLALGLIAAAGTALAQPCAASAQTEVLDPGRLRAAADLIDVVTPPARRNAMVEGMMTAMSANMRSAIGTNEVLEGNTRIKAIFDRTMAAQTADASAALKAALPGMVTAMTRAYARRFTVAQMAEMRTFFTTPTGQLYMEQGSTIMADPDVAAWQQTVTARQFEKMRERIRAMQVEIMALPEKPE